MPESLQIAAAYVRVSTEDQTELSPDTQVKKIREYAKYHNLYVPDEFIYHDDGISGRSTKKRRGFNQMIAAAQSDPVPFHTILVWKFSRFARNREDSIVYKSMLKKRNIDVVSVSEDVGDDKMSILIESLIEAMDEYYSVNLSEEVIRGMTEKVNRGQAVSIPPLGYRIENGQFYIDEETAPIVRRIFDAFLHDVPTRKIAMELNQDGYRTRRGNPFQGRTVQYILRNPVYGGFIRWDIDGRGSRGMYRDGKEIVVKGQHEPFFDEETYKAIQEKIEDAKRTYQKHAHETATKHEWAFRGLARCSACGGTLCMSSALNSVQCYRYAHGECTVSHAVSIKKLTAGVLKALKDDLQSSALHIAYTTPNLRVNEDYAKQIRREEEKLERIKNAYMAGIDTLEEYKENKAIISAAIDELRQKQASGATAADEKEALKKLKDRIREAIMLLESPTASEADKNNSLRSFVSKIVFSRPTSSVTMYYFF